MITDDIFNETKPNARFRALRKLQREIVKELRRDSDDDIKVAVKPLPHARVKHGNTPIEIDLIRGGHKLYLVLDKSGGRYNLSDDDDLFDIYLDKSEAEPDEYQYVFDEFSASAEDHDLEAELIGDDIDSGHAETFAWSTSLENIPILASDMYDFASENNL